jgi:transcriptional regulator with XRE-family HTH domain
MLLFVARKKYKMKVKKETFATKLKRLFEEKRKPDGSQYSQTEVVEGTNEMLTRVYLWRLLTGRASNPGLQVIQALADFFEVDASYFFESDDINAELNRESEKRDQLVDQIALRSSELDSAGKQAVLYMIESIVKSKK